MTTKWMRTAALLLLPVMAACEEDPVASDPADDLAQIRLLIGTQTININEGGPDKAITIPFGTTAISATFWRANGTQLSLPSSSYRLDITSANSGRVIFTRGSSNFGGTLNGVTTGSTTLSIGLFHTGEDHYDFGPHNVNITVQQATDS